MAQEQTNGPDEEPTRVSSAGNAASAPAEGGAPAPSKPPTDGETGDDASSEAPLWPAPPHVESTAPPAVTHDSRTGNQDDVARNEDADREAGAGPGSADPTGDPSATRSRGRTAADRTAEGAKVAADKVSQAASATAQALRDTDVGEIARHTTRLIENTRPFFLAAFAVVFTFLAAVENHAAIGVVFAVGALLCVLGAAFSPAIDQLLKRPDQDDRGR